MTNLPKITVVTPSFNQGQYLEETILSIINQQYPNLEYIIIDGGSKDNSVDIIKKYEKHLHFWVSEKDSGQSEAINKGLKKATGEIVTWINSDDLLYADILNKVPNYFSDPETGLIHGRNIAFGEGRPESISTLEPEELTQKYLGRVAFPQPASFFRRRVLLEHGYLDESFHYGMDYDLFLKIALNYNLRPIEDIVSKYRFHASSKSVSEAFRFAPDWARAFSKLLRSFPFTNPLIKDMQNLGLYHESTETYQVTKKFTLPDLERAYLYFLQEQAQCYYSDYQLAKAKKITARIKELDAAFYQKYKLNDINFRSTYLNKPLLQFLKKIR